MAGFVASAAPVLPVGLAELKADARIATSDEDALLAGFAGRRRICAKRFTGILLIARQVSEIVPAARPGRGLAPRRCDRSRALAALGPDGAAALLAAEAYAIDIDAGGRGLGAADGRRGRERG